LTGSQVGHLDVDPFQFVKEHFTEALDGELGCPVSGEDHNMYAVNAADGEMRWKFATMSAGFISCGRRGHVYFGSVDGFFYAVDAESGELKWKFKTDCERRFSAPGVHE